MTAVLREQQRALAAAVRGGVAAADLFAPNARGGAPLLDAYRDGYVVRLTSALRDNFEILARAMGDERFDALAAAYIARHPSRRPSIRWFGHRLAEFMAAQIDADSPLVPHPALVDFARMDWALRDAFDAADAPALDRTALAGVRPEAFAALRFVPHPSLALVALDWAVEPAWRVLRAHDPQSGDEPELPAPQRQPHCLLVWRVRLQTQWRSLDDGEAAMLRDLVDGDDFAALCERAAAVATDAPAIAASALAQWLDEGLITGVNSPPGGGVATSAPRGG